MTRGEHADFSSQAGDDHAIADFDQAIKMSPRHAAAYHNRAWAYFKLGKAERALPDAMKALELRSDDAIALGRRGHIHKALGQKAKAIADFRKALELDPSTKGIKEALQRLGEEH